MFTNIGLNYFHDYMKRKKNFGNGNFVFKTKGVRMEKKKSL